MSALGQIIKSKVSEEFDGKLIAIKTPDPANCQLLICLDVFK